MFVFVLVLCLLAAAVVVGAFLRPKADKALSVVKDEVGEVAQAASDVKKDLSK